MTFTTRVLRPLPGFVSFLLVTSLVPAQDRDRDAVQASIERAFVRSDPDELAPSLSRRLKIYLAVPSLGIDDAYYGADQSIMLLRRLLERRTTLRFIPGQGVRPTPDAPAVVTARWVLRDYDGAERDLRISFTLAWEGSRLAIREIRELK